MRKLLTTVAMLAALTAPAFAESIPAQFRGEWCPVNDGLKNPMLYKRGHCSDEQDNGRIIDARGISTNEFGCAIAKRLFSKPYKARFNCAETPKYSWVLDVQWERHGKYLIEVMTEVASANAPSSRKSARPDEITKENEHENPAYSNPAYINCCYNDSGSTDDVPRLTRPDHRHRYSRQPRHDRLPRLSRPDDQHVKPL
jgi:hypothetical protein